MPGYNRARGVSWPVTFRVADGRLFTVLPPMVGVGVGVGAAGLVLRCRVEGGPGAGDHEIGRYYGEQSAGAVIGRTIREWILRTGEAIAIAKREVP